MGGVYTNLGGAVQGGPMMLRFGWRHSAVGGLSHGWTAEWPKLADSGMAACGRSRVRSGDGHQSSSGGPLVVVRLNAMHQRSMVGPWALRRVAPGPEGHARSMAFESATQ